MGLSRPARWHPAHRLRLRSLLPRCDGQVAGRIRGNYRPSPRSLPASSRPRKLTARRSQSERRGGGRPKPTEDPLRDQPAAPLLLSSYLRQVRGTRALEGSKIVLVCQRQAYIVETFHKPSASEIVHLERLSHARTRNGTLHKLDGYYSLRVGSHGVEELLYGSFRQFYGQQPDLGSVVLEDVGERRSDDRAKSVVLQGPRRVLAAGSAAEVLAR